MRKNVTLFCWALGTALVCVGLGSTASAAVMEFVTVGNPGNPGNTAWTTTHGYGAVGYSYDIGKYEVTAGQYVEFLNVVDPTGANSLSLYNPLMASDSYGCKITWNAGASTYDFSARPSGTEADWANRPVNYVSWYDAARFANWMTSGDTEVGAYGFDSGGNFTGINRAQAVGQFEEAYVIPTADEWYKAAYHKNDGATGNYWEYPATSDTPPGNQLPDSGNNANYTDIAHALGWPWYRTEMGEFVNSASPYGTFDQGGNVYEWNESLYVNDTRGTLGGHFDESVSYLHARETSSNSPTYEGARFGFRVGAYYVPEPGSAMMLLFGALAGLLWRRRRG